MTEPRVVPAAEADLEALDAFLRRFFGDAKAAFLRRHGAWWHRGEENRWVLLDGEVIAGYCGVIPTTCVVGGEPRDAVWWLDLVIAPEYRGRGLQTRFDDLVRSRGELLLGFPNAVAAEIHRHHGWGVREDLRTLLLPLRPREVGAIRRASGLRGTALRSVAGALAPAAALWRRRLGRYSPRSARRLEAVEYAELADVASGAAFGMATESRDRHWITTRRDEAYLRWRYGEAPHDHRVYVAGEGPSPRLVLVARRVGREESRGPGVAERWLDLFGELDDLRLLDDLIRCALRDAARDSVAQVTVLVSHPLLRRAFRRAGFVLGSTSRFCWLDDDRETMEAIASLPHHWCLGDSDNDEPAVEEPGEPDEP